MAGVHCTYNTHVDCPTGIKGLSFVSVLFDWWHDIPTDIWVFPFPFFCLWLVISFLQFITYLTVILRGRAGYELIYITKEAVGRVGYYQLISGKSVLPCFSKFSSNSLDFFGWNLLKSWHFLYRRRREKIFSDLQTFSTTNSPSVFPY